MALGGPEALDSFVGAAYNSLISFLAGGASVTPGLDGSYVLLLGCTYSPVLEAVAALSKMVVHWGALLSTGISAAVGILVFSKLIDTLIKRSPPMAYYGVLGLVVGSVYGLWPKEVTVMVSAWALVLSFMVGLCVALLLGRAPAQE